MKKIKKEAKNSNKKIILLDGEEKRVQAVAKYLERNKYAKVILLKNKKPDYAMKMILKKKADCVLGGASHSTAEFLRPAFKIIGTKKNVKRASSFCILLKGKKVFFIADPAVNFNPTAEELAEIGYLTAKNVKMLGIEPKVAMLSYSTAGSAKGESALKVKKATEILKKKIEKDDELKSTIVEGETQFDAAIKPEIATRKNPKTELKGQANILIFPNLDSSNIALKIFQHIAGYTMIGPILQGVKCTVNDLSRSSNVVDIIDTALLTIYMSMKKDYNKINTISKK